jgi:hypothetical protein
VSLHLAEVLGLNLGRIGRDSQHVLDEDTFALGYGSTVGLAQKPSSGGSSNPSAVSWRRDPPKQPSHRRAWATSMIAMFRASQENADWPEDWLNKLSSAMTRALRIRGAPAGQPGGHRDLDASHAL